MKKVAKSFGADVACTVENQPVGEYQPDGSAFRHRRRRSLVLCDDAARHPYRASLPPHVRRDLHDIPAESLWRLTADDVRGVAHTYVATTAAVLAFIL